MKRIEIDDAGPPPPEPRPEPPEPCGECLACGYDGAWSTGLAMSGEPRGALLAPAAVCPQCHAWLFLSPRLIAFIDRRAKAAARAEAMP